MTIFRLLPWNFARQENLAQAATPLLLALGVRSFATWIWSPASPSCVQAILFEGAQFTLDLGTITLKHQDLLNTSAALLNARQVWEPVLQHKDKLTHYETLKVLHFFFFKLWTLFRPLMNQSAKALLSVLFSLTLSRIGNWLNEKEKGRESKARWGRCWAFCRTERVREWRGILGTFFGKTGYFLIIQ